MKQRKIIIVVPTGIRRGIIESQVLGVAELFRRHFGVCELWCLPESESFVPGGRVYTRLADIDFQGVDAIYTRSCFDFLKLFFLLRWRSNCPEFIYDFRGLGFEEHHCKNGFGPKVLILQAMEWFIYKNADTIHCVSNNFRRYLEKHWGPVRRINVIPCCTQSTVLKERRQDGPLRFVYVGGMSKWQNIDVIFRYHKELSRLLPSSQFIIYTEDCDAMSRLADNHGVEASISRVVHAEIPEKLSQCDFGYLFRKLDTMNQVASPVKFLEYVANGVIPLITAGVGDYANDVQKNKIGVVVSMEGDNVVSEKDEMLSLIESADIYSRLYAYSEKLTWDNQDLDYS